MSSYKERREVSGKSATSDSSTPLASTRAKSSSNISKTSQSTFGGSMIRTENHKKKSYKSSKNPFADLCQQAIDSGLSTPCSISKTKNNCVPVVSPDGTSDWICGPGFAYFTGDDETKCLYGSRCKQKHVKACKNYAQGRCTRKNCKFVHVRLWKPPTPLCMECETPDKLRPLSTSLCIHWKNPKKCRHHQCGKCTYAHSLDEVNLEPHLIFLRQVIDNPEKYPEFFEDIRNELVRVIYQDEVLAFIQAELKKGGNIFKPPSPNNMGTLLYTWSRFYITFRKNSSLGPKMSLFDGQDCLMEKVVFKMAINSQRQCTREDCTWHHNCRSGYHLEPDKILQPFWFDFTYISGGESNKSMIDELEILEEVGFGDSNFLAEDFSDGWEPLKPYEVEMKEKIDSLKKYVSRECHYGPNCRNYHECSFTHGIRDIPNSWSMVINDYDGRPKFFSQGITDHRNPDYKIVRSSGILFYSMVGEEKKFLLRYQQNSKMEFRYADLGGKSDPEDSTPVDTAIRETLEETNGHLFSSDDSLEECETKIKELFVNPPSQYYDSGGKYMLYLVEMDESFFNLPLDRFGVREGEDERVHSFHWLGTDEISREELHPRLDDFFYH